MNDLLSQCSCVNGSEVNTVYIQSVGGLIKVNKILELKDGDCLIAESLFIEKIEVYLAISNEFLTKIKVLPNLTIKTVLTMAQAFIPIDILNSHVVQLHETQDINQSNGALPLDGVVINSLIGPKLYLHLLPKVKM